MAVERFTQAELDVTGATLALPYIGQLATSEGPAPESGAMEQ